MLWNYALALRCLGRDSEAIEVSRRAIELPEDNLSNAHSLMLALDEALSGELKSAQARHSAINAASLREWDQFVHEMLADLFNFHYWREQGRKGHAAESISHLLRLAREADFFRRSATLIEAHRRVILSIARADGSRLRLIGAHLRLWWLRSVRDLNR
jgi:ATP/maltotriose-dependent transcriptional regulator MalT